MTFVLGGHTHRYFQNEHSQNYQKAKHATHSEHNATYVYESVSRAPIWTSCWSFTVECRHGSGHHCDSHCDSQSILCRHFFLTRHSLCDGPMTGYVTASFPHFVSGWFLHPKSPRFSQQCTTQKKATDWLVFIRSSTSFHIDHIIQQQQKG